MKEFAYKTNPLPIMEEWIVLHFGNSYNRLSIMPVKMKKAYYFSNKKLPYFDWSDCLAPNKLCDFSLKVPLNKKTVSAI